MTAKNQTLVLFIFVFFTGFSTFAEVLHWAQHCKNGKLTLHNKQNQTAAVWLQSFNKELVDEAEYVIPARSIATVEHHELVAARHSILHFNNSGSIEVNYHCENKIYAANSLEGGVLTFRKSDLSQNTIWIQNLYSGDNRIEIELIKHDQSISQKFTLQFQSFENELFKIPVTEKSWDFIRIKASHKYSSFNINQKGSAQYVQLLPQQSPVDTSGAYFLIGPQSGKDDSFVVKISDPEMIERARDLVRNPQKEKMMFARIQKDHQSFNRNWSKSEKNYWSWSVSEVTNFDDFGSITCNGTPQEVEDRVDFKVNTIGRICFWSYRVKKELSPQEVASGVQLNP